MDEMEQLMSGGTETAKESNARKNSGAPNRADYRKQSNVSAGSGNAQLNALFGKDQTSTATNSASNKPRIRINKDQMLAKFKRTTELDMKVFEADRILDYAELFISSGQKPTFKKGAALEDEEERDPFDDMMDEAKGEKKD